MTAPLLAHRAAALAALLAACAPAEPRSAPPLDTAEVPRSTVQDGLTAASGLIEVYFTDPGTEPGAETDPLLDDALLALIDASTTSLDLCLYEFELDAVADAALDAWERGVDVRLVSDGDEAHAVGTAALEAAGVPVTYRPAGNRIMHDKFVVVDHQAVWTGSTNVTPNGVYRNNNHAVVIESVPLAAEYTAEFEQMHTLARFGRQKTDVSTARAIAHGDHDLVLHFAPQHDPIVEVVDLIDSADHTVHFLIFSFTHDDVMQALLDAQARGVEVVGVFDESQANGAYSVDEDLALAGVPVYIDGNGNASGWSGGKLHHKVLVVDAGHPDSDPVAITGSFNWSNAATDDNDENLVELRDPAIVSQFADEFCRVLEVATLHPDAAEPSDHPCDNRPGLLINEILANPVGKDRGEEFVEVVNSGEVPLDLTGWTLSDGHQVRHRFSPRALDPGDAVVVFERGERPELRHAEAASTGFLSLDNMGDVLSLADADGVVRHTVRYLPAVEGVSWNRSADGDRAGELVRHDELVGAVKAMSPGKQSNGDAYPILPEPEPEPAVFQVVLNEVLPDPAGTDRGQEYVELVNLGPDPAPLRGFEIADETSTRHRFGDVVLAPGEALVLFDEGDHSGVPGAMNSDSGFLSLNNGGDAVTLTEPGGAVHDRVAWTGSVAGVAWNRSVDGGLDDTLVYHDELPGAAGPTSPGVRATGGAW